MTMPWRRSWPPSSILSAAACPVSIVAMRVRGLALSVRDSGAVVDLNTRAIAHRADHPITPDHDLFVGFQTLENFDFGGAGNSGLDRPELGLIAVHHEHALDFLAPSFL